jgi:PiT family inorganic phosphate transporter
MLVILLMLAAMLLAYANGANDNFKGVASLFGSRTYSYRTAIPLGAAIIGGVIYRFAASLNS